MGREREREREGKRPDGLRFGGGERARGRARPGGAARARAAVSRQEEGRGPRVGPTGHRERGGGIREAAAVGPDGPNWPVRVRVFPFFLFLFFYFLFKIINKYIFK